MRTALSLFIFSLFLSGNLCAQKLKRITSVPSHVRSTSTNLDTSNTMPIIHQASLPKLKRITSVPVCLSTACQERVATESTAVQEEPAEVTFNVLIYPNPATEGTNILVKSPNPFVKVFITDYDGNVEYKNDKVPSNEVLHCGYDFPTGNYIINVIDGTHMEVFRLVKK